MKVLDGVQPKYTLTGSLGIGGLVTVKMSNVTLQTPWARAQPRGLGGSLTGKLTRCIQAYSLRSGIPLIQAENVLSDLHELTSGSG